MNKKDNNMDNKNVLVNKPTSNDKKVALACTAGFLQNYSMMMLDPKATPDSYQRYESILNDVSGIVRFINSVEVDNV